MITLTDIFAGAGGSSTGAASVPGVEVVIAANHWQLAVDVHADNHQQTEHACVDLHLEDPRNFPRTDILWASPECTKWSIANSKAKELSREMGGDPTLFDHVPVELESSDEDEITRSRLLMFDVLRFIEHHRYRAVVVENVVDIATQAKYVAAWTAWQRGLRRLGYAYRVVSLNSMHAQLAGPPAPQSRDRLYIVAWPEGERAPDIDRALQPAAWCGHCGRMVASRQAWKQGRSVGRYRAQYVYACPDCGRTVEPGWLPASTAIDWTLPAERIGDRKHPLSEKTMARIREGLRRYGVGHGPLVMRNNTPRPGGSGAEMTTPAYEPLRTLTTTGHQSALMPRGVIIEAAGNTYDSMDPRHPQHGQPGAYVRAWPTTDPLRTLHASVSKGIVLDSIRSAPIISSVDEPFRTQTTAYTRSLLIPVEGREGKAAASVHDPLRTQTTRNETGLLVPSGGTWHEAAYPTTDPMRAVTTRENHGLLVPYYSASETAKPTTQPIGTLTTVDRYALVTLRGTNTPKPVSDPLDTVTASGNHHGLVNITEDDVMACRFRMLEPPEIAAGMAFPTGYRWRGTKRERVRLAGNAVTPPSSRDLITVIAWSLEAA